MILIADSGSTKTDWCVVSNGACVKQIFTKGINPFFITTEEISREVKEHLLPSLSELPIEAIYFYGAGCANPEKNKVVEDALAESFEARIEVNNDLLGAARALCGEQPGIACIMGTGSNSCYYDGEKIADNISPLGFILGDEGSGASLGKLLVGDVLKRQLPRHLCDRFFEESGLTAGEIVENVYRKPFPNRFLASLSPFLIRNIREPEIHQLVYNAFNAFLTRNVMLYDYENYNVNMIGSVAFYYKEVLRKAADDLGIRLGTITQSPMEGLIRFHQ
ncbi:MAG: ATPase [Bacteroidales bacterium]